MIRLIIENIVLFLLPTILYVAFVMLRQLGRPNNTPTRVLDEAPLVWLFGTGFAVMIAALAYFGTYNEGKPGQTYKPAVYKDGKITPGRIE